MVGFKTLNKASCTRHPLGKMAGFADEVLNVFLEHCKPEIDCLMGRKKFLMCIILLRKKMKTTLDI